MADEKLRVLTFDTVELDDGDWSGPTPVGELLTYTSNNDTASLKVTLGGSVVFDQDFLSNNTITIDGNVIHLPEGAQPEI